MLKILKMAITNKVVLFVLFGYATYFIQLINSLFIAVYLGPYYLGIWGFISLVIQYISLANFGISNSTNAIASINRHKEWYLSKLLGTAFGMLIGLSILVLFFFLFNRMFNINIGEKYNFVEFLPFILLIAIFGYFNTLMLNFLRIFGKLYEIALSQSLFPILVLLLITHLKGKDLLWGIMVVNCFAVIFSFCMFLIRCPVKFRISLITRLIKKIQRKGFHLFISNTAFYLILLSTRSFVSAFYGVAEFGYFTFSFLLSNSILLLLESLSFLIYPKMLNRFATGTPKKIHILINNIRDTYITVSHILIHAAILVFPIFLVVFPQYETSSSAFKMISLTIVLVTNSFCNSGLLVAKNKENKLGFLALIVLFVNVIITFVTVKYLRISFSFVIFSTMLSYLIFNYWIGVISLNLLNLNNNFICVIREVFPFKLFLPYSVSVIFVFLNVKNIFFILPFILILFMNIKSIFNVFSISRKLLNNSELVLFN